MFTTIWSLIFKWQPITDATDPTSFTNLSAKILSGDIAFSWLNLFIMKSLFRAHILTVLSQCIPGKIDTLHNKKSTSVKLGSIKTKNFSYPRVLHQQSLQTYAESHIIQFLELESVSTKIHIVQFVLNVERDAPPSQTSKTDYGCRWVNYLRVGTGRWPKVWSPSSPDTNPIDSNLWFFLKSNARYPADADMIHKKRLF